MTDGRRTRIELVHESLLTQWPRLVRWQAQDVEGAQLRDELRQAAQLWEQHGRIDDFLWTGTAFREYALWRERYPGSLSALEAEFGEAMTTLALRRKRRAKAVVAAALTLAVAVASALAVLWRRSTVEARRATGAKLLALGRSALADDRTAALAYVTESLRLADTEEARRFAVEVLWNGPTATVSPEGPAVPWSLHFSPEGSWLSVGYWTGDIRLWHRDGRRVAQLERFAGDGISHVIFDHDHPDVAAAAAGANEIRFYSLPEWTRRETVTLDQTPLGIRGSPDDEDGVIVLEGDLRRIHTGQTDEVRGRRWRASGTFELLGTFQTHTAPVVDAAKARVVYGFGNEIRTLPIDGLDSPPAVLGTHPDVFKLNSWPAIDRRGRFVAAHDEGTTMILWSLASPGGELRRRTSPPAAGTLATVLSADGSLLCVARGLEALVWEIDGATGAEAIRLPSIGGTQLSGCAIDPSNRWAATLRNNRIALWRLHGNRMRTFRGHSAGVMRIAFSPDSRYLYSLGARDGRVIRWPLAGSYDEGELVAHQQEAAWGWGLTVDPQNRFLIATTVSATWLVPFDRAAPQRLGKGLSSLPGPAIDPGGTRIVDSVFYNGPRTDLSLFDLASGRKAADLGSAAEGPADAWGFDSRGRVVVSRGGKLQVIDPATLVVRTLVSGGTWGLAFSPDLRRAVTDVDGRATLVDFETEKLETLAWDLTTRRPSSDDRNPFPGCALGPDDIAAEALMDGAVRVGRLHRGRPHLLLGHSGHVNQIALSEDGRWVAVATAVAVYVWPMPDLDAPPLHTLPRQQLIAKLRSLSNIRAVDDPSSPDGYRITIDEAAYTGWSKVEEW